MQEQTYSDRSTASTSSMVSSADVNGTEVYSHAGEHLGQGFECDVDLWNMIATENGQQRQLDPVVFDALNASDWTWDAAYERGFCTQS
mgnify:CR=1 FL=1